MQTNGKESVTDARKSIHFDELEQYYLSVQNKHVDSKQQRYRYAPNSDGS